MTPTSSLYDDVPLSVCVVLKSRKSMDVLFMNHAMSKMIGLSDKEQATGKAFQDVWPAADEASVFVKNLQSTTPAETYVLALETAAQGKRWVHLNIDESEWQGQPCFKLWGTDISANKAEQERLMAVAEKADAMADMKSNFLATMSHEIRTPMQTIFGLLELIMDDKPSANIASMAQTAQEASSGLLEILDDILDLAKMDANKMELDVFEVPVRTLVRGILEAMAVKVHGVQVELVDDISEDVPFVIIGDPKRLRQILINLLGNGLKFTKQGVVTVRVSSKVQHIFVADHQIGLRFEVVDTGIGMSEEVCSKLFQSFVQADNSTQREFGGTGLGLSISKKLVELMGGVIGVSSVEGQGSTFWFEIPTEEVSTEENTIELPDLDGISVISVEDHPQGAKEIVRSMQSMGATIESCATYKDGLDLITRRPFDVGIIDQGLPDGLGLDLIKEIVKVRPNMGLIMYTVRDDVGLSHSLTALGVNYLTKPASRAGLGEAVKNAVNQNIVFDHDRPKKLLIAEDTEGVREVLSRQLAKLDIDYDFAFNGQEALDKFQSGDYGLIITDLHMPEIDGYGVVEAIRAQDKETEETPFPVIVLTADVQMAQRETYLRHGFDECLLKPVSMGQFKRLLMRWGLMSQEAEIPEVAPVPDAGTDAIDSSALPSAIDQQAMIDNMGEFGANEIEMLGMFVDMTRPLIETLQGAHLQGDNHAIAEAAHSLKGAARSACAMVLGDIAGDIQDDAEAQKDCGQHIERLLQEYARVDAEIQRLQKDGAA